MYITTRQKKKIFLTVGLVCGVGFFFVLAITFVPRIWRDTDSDIKPQNVLLSNWKYDSVTITWTTEKRTRGKVFVYQNDEKITEFGDSRANRATFTHYVELKNLEPDKEYFFEIISNGKVFSEESGVKYSFLSAPVLGNPPAPNVVEGRIDDLNDSDVLVFLFPKEFESSVISTYVDSNGNWTLDIMDLRTKDLREYAKISHDSDSMVSLLFFSEWGSKTLVGNNNMLFGEDRFLADIKLTDQEADIFASLHEYSIITPTVMGEQDEAEVQNGRTLIRGKTEEDGEKEEGREDEQTTFERERERVDWVPLVN